MSVSPSIGSTIAGRYEIRALLRACASRHVYRAFDSEVEVEVALWWMRASLFADEAQRADFEERATRLRSLKHPHLIRIFAVGRCALAEGLEPGIYLSLQLGTTAQLEDGLQSGQPVDDGNFLRYAEGLVAAVQGAHDAGQLHGFLTPADVVEVAEQVKLCGVGLFGFLQPTKAFALWDAESRYLAPELADGAPVTESADWYSVAAILLELATGAQSNTPEAALAQLHQRDPKQAAALAPALLTDPVLRGRGADLLAAIRLAWHDPLAEDELPTVIDEQERTEFHGSPPDVFASATRDVGVISFMDDGEDATTVLHQAPADPGASTIVDSAAALKLDMVSRKPATPFEQRAAKQLADQRSPVRPVLRPLSSLGGPVATGGQDLGTLAPPRPSPRRTSYWLYVAIALLLGALSVAALMMFAL